MPMKNKDLLEVPLAELDLDKTLPSPVMYQYYKI